MLRSVLLFTALIGLAGAATAQTVIFEEDFDAGIPRSWTNLQLDYTGDIWETGFGLVNGSGDVFHEGFCDFGIFFRDNILLSPRIDLTRVTNATFKCDQHHSSSASLFYNAIEVTTDHGFSYSVVHVVDVTRDGASTITVNLDQFVGQTIQVALHYQGVISNNWSVDNISVTTPWTDLGNALGGILPVEPLLIGTGPLTPDSDIELNLTNGIQGVLAYLVIGFSSIDAPFLGGTMVPSPDLTPVFITDDGNGTVSVKGRWPAGVPSEFTTYFQFWLQDGAGPFGFLASNAISGTTP